MGPNKHVPRYLSGFFSSDLSMVPVRSDKQQTSRENKTKWKGKMRRVGESCEQISCARGGPSNPRDHEHHGKTTTDGSTASRATRSTKQQRGRQTEQTTQTTRSNYAGHSANKNTQTQFTGVGLRPGLGNRVADVEDAAARVDHAVQLVYKIRKTQKNRNKRFNINHFQLPMSYLNKHDQRRSASARWGTRAGAKLGKPAN